MRIARSLRPGQKTTASITSEPLEWLEQAGVRVARDPRLRRGLIEADALARAVAGLRGAIELERQS
jgi:hypothetical protein